MLLLNAEPFINYRENFQRNFDRVKTRVFELLRTSTKYRNVFSHVDLWTSNVMFKYNDENGQKIPTQAILLDFQLSRYLPPAVDVLISIYLNTNRKFRDQYFNHLKSLYWTHLRCELKHRKISIDAVLTWDDFIDSCQQYELLGILYNCRFTPFSNLPSNTLQQMEPSQRQYACIDGRGEYFLSKLPMDEKFRLTVLEAIGELAEKYFDAK